MLRLPVELLYKIFADFTLKLHDLVSVCCVCRFFDDVVESLLYENVILRLHHPDDSKELNNLVPRHTRHHLIRRLVFYTVDAEQCAPFQSLLRSSHQLQELYLLSMPTTIWKRDQPSHNVDLYILTGAIDCPFRLTKLHWDCRVSGLDLDGLVDFLEHQPCLEVLLLPCLKSPIKLSEQALPRLRVLWATVEFAASVLSIRPVTHLRLENISLKPFRKRPTAISSEMISKLELLDISSYDIERSSVFPFTAGMVNLESLRLQIAREDIHMLGDFPLHKLRNIHFSPFGSSKAITPAIILTLFTLIPSLECVIDQLPSEPGKSTQWDYFYRTGVSVRKKRYVPWLQARLFHYISYCLDEEWWRDREDGFEATEVKLQCIS